MLIAGFLALALAIAWAAMVPANGYEGSPYEAVPYVWVLLAAAIGLGSLQTVLEARYRSFGRAKFLYLGVALVLFARLTANFVGWIRGYFFVGRTDGLTHWGFALGIEQTGRTDPNNIYPLMHILLAQGSLLTGTTVKAMMVVLPAILGILAAVCIYLILRRIFKDHRVVALGTLSASLLLFGGAGPEISSSGFSLILIPLLLYLYLRSRTSVRFRIPLVLLLLAYPFIHPLTSLLLIVFLALGEAVAWRVHRTHPRTTPALLLSLAFFSWFSATVAFGHSVRSAMSLLSGDFQTSQLALYQAQANQASLPLADFAAVLFVSYADWVLFLFIGLAAVLILRSRSLFTVRASVMPLIIPFSILIIATLYLINLGFDPIRFVAFLMVGSVVYAGVLFARILRTGRSGQLRVAGVTVVAALIITAGIISVYKTHPSPLVLRPGTHVTETEVLGYFWFFESRDPSLVTYELLSGANRFAHTFAGSLGVSPLSLQTKPSPDHFEYDERQGIGGLSSGYLLVTAMDVVTYTNVWAFTDRFTREDFSRLEDSAAVHKVYESGGLQVYYIP
jgi:hypothetical protein